MKKLLLFAGVGSTLFASAQTVTVNDTLSSGSSATYYVLDSNAVNLSAVTGTGVTWDYSTISGYAGLPTNLDTVINRADSPYSADFLAADYNDDLNNGASVFFSNSVDSMTIHGFVLGVDTYTIVVQHNQNPLIGLKYPMTVGDSYTDLTAGQVDINGVANGPTTGTATISVDGSGTLKVGATTHSGITRVKLVETINATITIMPFPPTPATVTRTIYSYYDLVNEDLPIFLHATIDVISIPFNGGYVAVYSTDVPAYAGVDENTEIGFSVFPNPSASLVTITSDGTANKLTVINAVGQVVLTVLNPQNTETIDAAKFESGVYIIQLQKGDVVTNQKLIVE